MQELKVELRNCYGIESLSQTFDFNTHNVNAIYARNGLMKTSFSRTFNMVQQGKASEIKDEIFNRMPIQVDINEDGNTLNKEKIFVIKSFENSYESDNIADLLINRYLKERLSSVLSMQSSLLKRIESISGVKIKKTSLGKTVYDLEPIIISDFGFNQKSILLNISSIDLTSIDYDFSEIKYSDIFDKSVIKKIETEEFQDSIVDFMNRSDEIYSSYEFLDKGKFTLPKLKDMHKSLKKNQFFVKENKILLSGGVKLDDLNSLKRKIDEVDNELQDTAQFKKIEKLLSDAKGTILKDIIENNPSVIEELRLDNLDEFKKKLWMSYFNQESELFNSLLSEYEILRQEIDSTPTNQTPWMEALRIFESRFIVPYKMTITNIDSAVIGESIPKINFKFCKDGNHSNLSTENWIQLDRDELEAKNTLSQGERRALYLLNIIFDIEKRRIDDEETLFIVDDIADSFDYKNKYAIIEYLRDIVRNDSFKMLIFSHNFDFYRTVSSRLGVPRNSRYHVVKANGQVSFEVEQYQGQPVVAWKNCLNEKTVVALIPFIRNLVEFGVDRNVNNHDNYENDFDILTGILHVKEFSNSINISHLRPMFDTYLGNSEFEGLAVENNIQEHILELANRCDNTSTSLEDKVIVSIAVRLTAEEYMISKIREHNSVIRFRGRRRIEEIEPTEFFNRIRNAGNQTWRLFDAYQPIGDINTIKLLDRVNIMTPENIHLNSFMYEPILDMDIQELRSLYLQVRELS